MHVYLLFSQVGVHDFGRRIRDRLFHPMVIFRDDIDSIQSFNRQMHPIYPVCTPCV